MRAQNLVTDAQYRDTFLAHFDSLTPENELKMLFTEPEPGIYDFAPADALVDFAADNGKAVRGHTLVYGSQLPAWVTAPLIPWTAASLLAVMHDYISTVMHRYATQIDTWDVVNEAFNDDGSYRQNVWFDVIGPSYIEDAFRFAREADPTAKLFYNDLGAELQSPKAAAILAMIRDFESRGVPIDGIGLQDHTDVPGYPPEDELKAMVSRFAGLGLRIEITEMDVGLSEAQGTVAEREQQQAAAYRADATACWDIAACHRLTTWGLYDGLTWLGSDQMPLLFDTAYRPKPAFFAVQSALHR